jgi:hypothetical protein
MILMASIAISLVLVSAASAALPNQRTELRVLLLSATGNEPTTGAWEAELQREGVPYDKKVAVADAPYAANTFADTLADGTPHAKYQAVIVAIGGLVYQNDAGNYVSALSSDEWAALADFEARYGIRQITAFTYPTPEYGLNTPTVSGDLGGVTGNLTSAGQVVFPYLKGQVPIDNGAYGYQAQPVAGANFQTLVSGPNGSALVGINNRPDGGQELVETVDSNAYQLHSQLLRHGMLSWVTRGVYIGAERNYLSYHVDDIFLSSDRWDTATNQETEVKPVRMTQQDVSRAVKWSNTTGIKLDLLFNASGSGAFGGSRDKLTQALVSNKKSFTWVNHTWTGEPNNDTDYAHVVDDITRNIDWANAQGITIDPTELVFDQHSGYNNPNVFPALQATGVQWVGDDASRFFAQRPWGPALSVPRYPSNIYYNASTQTQMLDEYNYLYLPPQLGGSCVDSATTTCFSKPATWSDYVNREASTMLRHVLGNDPRPHYVHQANLADDGILYLVANEVIRRYGNYMKPTLVVPSQKQAGQLLDVQAKWDAAKSQVDAYLQGGQVHLSSTLPSALQVPLTGVGGVGNLYGGLTSGWTTLTPGAVINLNLL